MLNVIKCN